MKKTTRIFRVEIKVKGSFGDGWDTFKEEGNFVAKDAREAIDIAEVMLLNTEPFENDDGKIITPKYKNIETLNVELLAESSY